MPDTVLSVTPDLLRLRSEFLSMPGMCLTVCQAARLLSLPESKARVLLDVLVDEGLLVYTVSGIYRRPRLTTVIQPSL